MERDFNVTVMEPKRLFIYQLSNGKTIVSVFYNNGALLGQRHFGLRYIAYWPDNLPTCILKILVQLFHKSPDEANKPVTRQYMLCQFFERAKK